MHDTWESRQKDEWLTPPGIIHALGDFDLDPCAPVHRPWSTATHHYTVLDDGLIKPWFGRVWMNPPYGRETGIWLNKLATHGDGIALVFARTETKMFFKFIWSEANAILFMRGRLAFYHASGLQGGHAGAPSCLIAYGDRNVRALKGSGIVGALIIGRRKSRSRWTLDRVARDVWAD